MKVELGNNLPRIKVTNQASIKRIVYLYGPITRLEIAKALDLTLPTITTNISNMITHGIIEEVPNTESAETTVKVLGRKSNTVTIVADSRYFIGVELRKHNRYVCVTNYKGMIIASANDKTYLEEYNEIISSAGKIIKSLLSSKKLHNRKVYGIGICSPGIIDNQNGILRAQLQYHWYDKNICDDIRKITKFDGPVVLENDACARAIEVNLFNQSLLKGCHTFSYLYVADGISCPLLINNSNFVSTAVGPGELGYMIMDPNKPDNELGSTGRLSCFAGERSITEICTTAAREGRIPELKKILDNGERLHFQDILDAQKNGDQTVDEILRQAAAYLGTAIANVDNMVRPDSFLVEARLFENEQNRPVFLDSVNKNTFRPKSNAMRFTFITPDPYNGARGAAAVAVQNNLGVYIG